MEIVKQVLGKQGGVEFAYIFGSTVIGNTNKESDVDIGVYLASKDIITYFDIRLDLIRVLTQALGKEADVVILNRAAPFLRYVVIREGKLVFERSEESRVNFELKTLQEYYDYKPYLEKYYKRLVK